MISTSKKDDIFLIESVLSAFIPFYSTIAKIDFTSATKEEKVMEINNVLNIIDSFTSSKKKKKHFYQINGIKLEERNFLYKAYISSSDSNQKGTKLFSEEVFNLTNLSAQMLKGLITLIKEEILTNHQKKLINKLLEVKKLIISENKNFNFKSLFIFFEFIIYNFCPNLEEICFDKISTGKVDQIDVILKNGIYLHFILRKEKVKKFICNNKIEFLNENSVFNILYNYLEKNKVVDVIAEQIATNNINIVGCLSYKTNVETFKIKKTCIDKIEIIEQIIELIKNNLTLFKITIDKFVSLPNNLKNILIQEIKRLSNNFCLRRIKISISSSVLDDLSFLNLIYSCINLKRLSLLLCRQTIHEFDIIKYLGAHNLYGNQNNFLLEKFELIAGKINFDKENSLFLSLLPKNLKYLSLGLVDETIIYVLNKFIRNLKFQYKLTTLKIHFLPINEETIDKTYHEFVSLIEDGRNIKNIYFYNYFIKYKNIVDNELKKALSKNINLRRLYIRGDKVFSTTSLKNFFYYEYPMFLIYPLLFMFKKSSTFKAIYTRKIILENIFKFFRIKKEKEITLTYK